MSLFHKWRKRQKRGNPVANKNMVEKIFQKSFFFKNNSNYHFWLLLYVWFFVKIYQQVWVRSLPFPSRYQQWPCMIPNQPWSLLWYVRPQLSHSHSHSPYAWRHFSIYCPAHWVLTLSTVRTVGRCCCSTPLFSVTGEITNVRMGQTFW